MKNQFLYKQFQLGAKIAVASIVMTLPGCKTSNLGYYQGFNKSAQVIPSVIRGKFNPPGMVYIPSGTIVHKSPTTGEIRKVSVSAFYIDEAEVTNKQYRFFATWVADSIAVTDFLRDPKFFKKKSSKEGIQNDTTNLGLIDWSEVRKYSPIWKSTNPSFAQKLKPLINDEGGERSLNTDLIKYKYTYTSINADLTNTYITEFIPVYPKKNVWSIDFPNTQMEIMDMNYFKDKTYDYHPVVGINWKQAKAFADWRGKTIQFIFKSNPYLPKTKTGLSLPTEAQWELAAKENDTDSTGINQFYQKQGKNTKLALNFKQGEGDYSEDGGTFTLPVRSYNKNINGLYNVKGNVSEWTLDAYSPSSFELTNDLNPVLKYDAKENESSSMRRKVVRGGSWKDNASEVSLNSRSYDIQEAAHSYLGFRCVLPAYELPSDQVKSRASKTKSKSKN